MVRYRFVAVRIAYAGSIPVLDASWRISLLMSVSADPTSHWAHRPGYEYAPSAARRALVETAGGRIASLERQLAGEQGEKLRRTAAVELGTSVTQSRGGCTRRSLRIRATLGKLSRAASGTWSQASVPGLPTQ